MNASDARQIQESSRDTLSPLVVDLLRWANEGIKEAASLGRNSLDLTCMIPSYSGNERSAWFVVMDELRKNGFSISSNYLGRAYAINSNHYSYYVKW
jgi:hypothetical protein